MNTSAHQSPRERPPPPQPPPPPPQKPPPSSWLDDDRLDEDGAGGGCSASPTLVAGLTPSGSTAGCSTTRTWPFDTMRVRSTATNDVNSVTRWKRSPSSVTGPRTSCSSALSINVSILRRAHSDATGSKLLTAG